MKKLFVICVLLLGVAGYSQGYTITHHDYDKAGKDHVTTTHYKGEWKVYDLDKQESDSTATKDYWRTSDTAIYHGSRYPVYLSKGNKLFIWVQADGETRRKYIN